MLTKSADDKSKRLALLQDLQHSPMPEARHKIGEISYGSVR
jgi:hypothetical protein